MKIKFNLDDQLSEERAEFWLRKMTPKISRFAKDLANEQESIWCYRDHEIIPVAFSEIIAIEVENEKLQVLTDKEVYWYKGRLYQVLQLLPADFIAASRSAVINYRQIHHLEILDNGNIDAIMKNELRIQFSRRKIKELKERLGL